MTRLTDATQTFHRPVYQQQGPDDNCQISGHFLGWDSCTAYSGTMGVDSTTGGKQRPSGCSVRRHTVPLDTSGGLTLRQVADAITNLGGPSMTTYTGANVLTPQRVAQLVRAGHKCVVQGNAAAMLGTAFKSTNGAVNHAVFINEVRGGTVNEPLEALVYDPAADGRRSDIDQGPSWWPWWLVKRFVAALQPSGSGPVLGSGKVYTGAFQDSEPHLNLRSGATRSKPYPDRTRAIENGVRIHSAPSSRAKTLYTVPNGQLLVGYQYAHGTVYQRSDVWLGNDDGNEWVHSKRVTHFGGTT